MCAGAAFWTRIGAIVYGAEDRKRGFSHVSQKILFIQKQRSLVRY
jgi:tRNA(adenine34) deaminase